jgi:hypothetical protein
MKQKVIVYGRHKTYHYTPDGDRAYCQRGNMSTVSDWRHLIVGESPYAAVVMTERKAVSLDKRPCLRCSSQV